MRIRITLLGVHNEGVGKVRGFGVEAVGSPLVRLVTVGLGMIPYRGVDPALAYDEHDAALKIQCILLLLLFTRISQTLLEQVVAALTLLAMAGEPRE